MKREKIALSKNIKGTHKTIRMQNVLTTRLKYGAIGLPAPNRRIWCSKLQTQVSLSTTEAEYVSLSQSLRKVIPVINLIKEMKERNISTVSSAPTVFCKAFEDNSGALELAKSPKMRPRTKHLHLVYHHFREHVCKRIVQLFPISTNFQLAVISTKPLPKELFIKFRKSIMGW